MNKSSINLVSIGLMILIIGVLSGYSVGYLKAKQNTFPEIKWVNDINPGISTVKLLENKGGHILGEITGKETRIAYHPDHILTLQPGGSFKIPISGIRLGEYFQSKGIPDKMLFVASRKGKYYYSVFDSNAGRIKKENRVYFETEDKAKELGFLKK